MMLDEQVAVPTRQHLELMHHGRTGESAFDGEPPSIDLIDVKHQRKFERRARGDQLVDKALPEPNLVAVSPLVQNSHDAFVIQDVHPSLAAMASKSVRGDTQRPQHSLESRIIGEAHDGQSHTIR